MGNRIGAGLGQELNVSVIPKHVVGWKKLWSIENEIAEENQEDNKDFHKATF